MVVRDQVEHGLVRVDVDVAREKLGQHMSRLDGGAPDDCAAAAARAIRSIARSTGLATRGHALGPLGFAPYAVVGLLMSRAVPRFTLRSRARRPR